MSEEVKPAEEKKKGWVYKGDGWYENLDVSVETLDKVIAIAVGFLVIIIVLIILEAAGIFKL